MSGVSIECMVPRSESRAAELRIAARSEFRAGIERAPGLNMVGLEGEHAAQGCFDCASVSTVSHQQPGEHQPGLERLGHRGDRLFQHAAGQGDFARLKMKLGAQHRGRQATQGAERAQAINQRVGLGRSALLEVEEAELVKRTHILRPLVEGQAPLGFGFGVASLGPVKPRRLWRAICPRMPGGAMIADSTAGGSSSSLRSRTSAAGNSPSSESKTASRNDSSTSSG